MLHLVFVGAVVGALVFWAQFSARRWVRLAVVVALLAIIGFVSFASTEVTVRAERGRAAKDATISDAHLEGMARMMREAQIARVPIVGAALGLAFLAIARRQ